MNKHNILLLAIRIFFAFFKNVWGLLNSPYKTYRKLANQFSIGQIAIIWSLVVFYLSLATFIRSGLSLQPLYLTLSFGKAFTFTLLTYFFVIFSLYKLGKLVGGKGSIVGFFLPWTYSLMPTLIWFFSTSFFYLLLPPPRTMYVLGQVFSILFIAFSLSLFFWKGLLYYLTLRFVHRLDLFQILKVTAVFLPLLAVYSLLMYELKIFRVPFI